jgi:ADP-heptose:LPS heptosyltransferase
VCSGNPKHKNDHNRSLPLSDFEPLAKLVGGPLYVIQKELKPADATTLAGTSDFIDLSDKLSDFTDTAAVIANLDLVISVDTSVVHLAGAMGKPIWTLLPFSPDWRWLLDRQDSPWYPTMRLFRQPVPGRWSPVMSNIAATLQNLARAT